MSWKGISFLGIAFSSLLCFNQTAVAQKHMTDIQRDSLIKSHHIMYFGEGSQPSRDSVENQILRFYVDQFRHFSDPLAPYFLFMSRDTQLAMGIGGCVRMRGWYDWGGAIPANGFAPYLIPMTKNPLRMRALGTTPAGTCLFYRVIGRNKALGQYQVYIEANFNGYSSRDFQLKKAYAVLNDVTIGYANSTFSDPAALPPTVDASGPNCKMSATSVLVRWMHDFKKGFTIAASVETPDTHITPVAGQTAAVTDYVPDIAAFTQYAWGSSNHIRFAGIMRFIPYRNLLKEQNHNVAGGGMQLSGVVHAATQWTFYGCINGGKGFQSLGGDWLMGNYDLIADPKKAGVMKTPWGYGGYAAVQYNFRPNIFASATFGGAAYRPGKMAEPTEYDNGLYMAANVYWNVTARIQVAAEFNLGRRENFDGAKMWARRAGLMAQFSF